MARAWLRHELERRITAELREEDERRRRLGVGGGQAFRAFIQLNLIPRSR